MILESLSLIAISFVGTVVWVLSPEATAVIYGSQGRLPAVVVGALCATGQGLMVVLLYYMGAQLCERWTWLKHKVEKTRQRFGARLNQHFLLLSLPAGIFGIPPMLAMAAMAHGFRVRLVPFLAIAAGGRFLRFTVLAASGEKALEYFATWAPPPIWTEMPWNQFVSL